MADWQKQYQLLIGGEWVDGATGTSPIVNPATEEVVGEAPEASVAAGAGSRPRRPGGVPGVVGAHPPPSGPGCCARVADRLREHGPDLVPLIIAETGATAKVGSRMQVPVAIERFQRYAATRRSVTRHPAAAVADAGHAARPRRADGRVVNRQPVGAVACISPYNFPIVNMAGKIAPALAVGCTVVMKPAPQDPLAVIELVEIMHEVGFPPGVVNVVTSSAPEPAAALTEPRRRHGVSFTGSTAVGAADLRRRRATR